MTFPEDESPAAQANPEPLIEVEGLCRHYLRRRDARLENGWLGRLFPGRERVVALDDVSFRVGAGELVGYLGPNGSGKSTTVKCLTGVLVPSGGRVTSLGMVPWKDRLRYTARIGVVFGQRSLLYWELAVRDSLELYREIYGLDRGRLARRIDELDDILGVGALLGRRVYELSLGERMRCELAASLIHSPKLLFLDEPTIGLDAEAKDALRQLIRRLHGKKELTVFLTTHQMEEIETLCTRLLLLARGRLVFDGSPARLRDRFLPAKRVHVRFSAVTDAAGLERALEEVRVLERGEDFMLLETPRAAASAQVTFRLLKSLEVVDLEVREPDLDSVLRAAYSAWRAEGEGGAP